ncbi:hypothetical protein JIG36_08000 [Actinoplanes sp. LDG1-06]|uniref:Uncharacterized protein n=1 Tax=Paractinoplanes ovalisporus TaxID=2810368 RepID=A0ABS2A6N3_9ACTN|nr:hemopexin repeat-containing protein [Actinoplanes ovalisporus]MBM2615507.1 hypothetical protein [Actinoplanes ovalisporus]
MVERYIDAARSNADGSHEATFFLADHYVVFDYDRNRVNDGVHAVAGLGFGLPFSPVGPDQSLDAALKGRGAHSRTGYQFRGSRYARVDLTSGLGDSGLGELTAWALPGTNGHGVDAAFNGRGPTRDGKAYFFRGDQYTRYDWKLEKPDPEYPRPISAVPGMLAPFTESLDAAVDGEGAYAKAGYLFKGGDYLRVNWDPPRGQGEPRVEGPARSIQQGWTGLVELLLAGKAKAQALVWTTDATRHLAVPFDPLFATALATHFHVAPTASALEKATAIALVQAQFQRVVTALAESSIRFRFRTAEESMRLDHNGEAPSVYFWDTRINFTPRFPACDPSARAASVLRETVRAVDPSAATVSAHVPEWYVSDPEADRLGLPRVRDDPRWTVRYDHSSTARALHNPSAYAAFARHLSLGRDSRRP